MLKAYCLKLCLAVRQLRSFPTRRSSDLIAEGRGRATDADFAHFVTMGIGSINEVENHLQRGYDGDLIPFAEFESLIEAATKANKMILVTRKSLKGGARKPKRDPETQRRQ